MRETSVEGGWFDGVEPADVESGAAAIRDGSADEPRNWPSVAIEAGFAADTDEYYERLHEAAIRATGGHVRERERADDRQLVHAVRAMDDAERVANELAERLAEWAGSRFDVEPGVDGARAIVDREPGDATVGGGDATDERVVSLARRVVDLADEADDLRVFVEQTAPVVAPNLSALAGPVLAARLIALAGGLGALARKPSGTTQVLGAEDALFAHLRGHAPSPKHGIIYTHEYVAGTRLGDRGSAARALAGKLTIAARVDHYSGERRPELDEELRDRIARIQSRTADDEAGEENDG